MNMQRKTFILNVDLIKIIKFYNIWKTSASASSLLIEKHIYSLLQLLLQWLFGGELKWKREKTMTPTCSWVHNGLFGVLVVVVVVGDGAFIKSQCPVCKDCKCWRRNIKSKSKNKNN